MLATEEIEQIPPALEEIVFQSLAELVDQRDEALEPPGTSWALPIPK